MRFRPFQVVRIFGALAALGSVLALTEAAHANKYGELHIKRNTTLSDDQFGSVVFDADNVTLDCAGRKIHSSSATLPNCGTDSQGKCAIYARDRINIVIKNCNLVGQFDVGTYTYYSAGVTLDNVNVTVTGTGLLLENTSAISAQHVFVTGGTTGLRITGSYGDFDDLNIEDATEAGIDSSYNMGINYSGLYVDHTAGYAIQDQYDAEISYFAASITRNYAGIYSLYSNQIKITSSFVTSSAVWGIQLFHDNYDVVSNTYAHGNDEFETGYGDVFAVSSGVTWSNNDFGSFFQGQ